MRFFIDYHQITKNAKLVERERLTNLVRTELQNYSRVNAGELRPMNVQTRLPEDALHSKYFRLTPATEDGHSSTTSVSEDIKTEPTSGSDEEKMEILVQPEEIRFEQKVYSGPRQKMVKSTNSKPPPATVQSRAGGQSLLKPIHQRKIEEFEPEVKIRVVRPEVGIRKVEKVVEKPAEQPAAISLSRLRLAAALCKAKDENKGQQTQNRTETASPEITMSVKCNESLSPSQSSNGSSIEMEPVKDEQNATDLGQEGFLRLFGLFTPAYAEYMMNRRPQRKKRLCTSTERGDFHYGKFELFERQFANKRQRQFLYSPPATRAKRRVGSNGNAQVKEPAVQTKKAKGIKSNASSSSSISSNGSNQISEKVCLTCYKRSEYIHFLTSIQLVTTHTNHNGISNFR